MIAKLFFNWRHSDCFCKMHRKFEKIKITVNLISLEENLYVLQETIVYEGLQYSGKLKSVALLVNDLEI